VLTAWADESGSRPDLDPGAYLLAAGRQAQIGGLGAARCDPGFGAAHEAQQQVRKLNDLRGFDRIGEVDCSVAGRILEGADGAGKQIHRRYLLTVVTVEPA